MRVVVVGAGLAGLAAADTLARAGDTIVAEARRRLGGRVWSDRLDNNGLSERGAGFITDGYDATERFAARLGLVLDGMGVHDPDRELAPDPRLDPAAVAAAARTVERAAAAADTSERAVDPLARTVADPALRDLLKSRLQSARAYPVAGLDARFLRDISHLVATRDGTGPRPWKERFGPANARLLTSSRSARTLRDGRNATTDRPGPILCGTPRDSDDRRVSRRRCAPPLPVRRAPDSPDAGRQLADRRRPGGALRRDREHRRPPKRHRYRPGQRW